MLLHRQRSPERQRDQEGKTFHQGVCWADGGVFLEGTWGIVSLGGDHGPGLPGGLAECLYCSPWRPTEITEGYFEDELKAWVSRLTS